MPEPTTNHSFKTCGGPEAITSTTIFKKRGGKTSSGGGGMLHPVNPLRVPLPKHKYIYIVFFTYSILYIYLFIYMYVLFSPEAGTKSKHRELNKFILRAVAHIILLCC